MCEFCSLSGSTRVDRDSTDARFRGFFTSEAIDAAVRKAAAATSAKTTTKRSHNRKSSAENDDDDDDGT
jgi:hypothetical protein